MNPAMASSKKRAKAPDGTMPLTGHLKELRDRSFVCVLVLAAGFVLCLAFAPRLVTLFTDMGRGYGYRFVYIAPQELLMVYFSVAMVGALVAAAPVIAWQVYAFCQPGLKKAERAGTLTALAAGAVCFCGGVAFAYFISLPFMLHFLIAFSRDVRITASISIAEYVHFLLTVFVIFGLVFELPVVSVLLTALGILQPRWLQKGRRVMIVLIFFIAAVITPPDVVSQIMVAVPMLGLYELSIWLSLLCQRLKGKKKSE